MAIYEDILTLCEEADELDKTSEVSKRVWDWLESAYCPLQPEEDE